MEVRDFVERTKAGSDAGPRRGTVARILLVEDSLADVRLMQEVLEEYGMLDSLLLARDGEQAMRMLRGEGEHAGFILPDVVLLDLNLPRKDGRQVLREIKTDPRLRRLPVLVLSTSIADADVQDCYDAHANCYIPKPVDLADFFALARALRDFWLGVVCLPRHAAAEDGS